MLHDEIRVFEDFLPEELRQTCYHKLSLPQWSFDGGSAHSRFWHMNELEVDPFFNTILMRYVLDAINDRAGYNIKRIYANGQTATQSGVIHRDHDDETAWTFLYYSTPNWKPAYAGNTIFFDEKENIVKTVQYKSNRAVLFPSRIPHMAEAPARQYGGLRTTIAYKLDMIKTE